MLPLINEYGDLPPGVYPATLNELIQYFGSGSEQRQLVTRRLMKDNFRVESCPIEAKGLFDHSTAQARYGASIFWVRPGLLIGETIEEFVSYWQIKRDGSKRGIVEVISR